jgi:hypothetical protein
MPDLLEDYRRRLLERYRAQPEELRRSLAPLSGDALHRPLEPGGWSAHQVAVHVRDAEAKAFAPRVIQIVEQESPELANFDSEAWMTEHYTPAESVSSIVDEIERVRAAALERIHSLPPEGWNRSGRHPARGWKTVQWWLEYSVAHTQEHIEQLGRVA